MRLDKFLKVARLIKRRTLAKEACDAGRVAVNGRPAKAGQEVKPGDVLTLSLGAKARRVEILSTPAAVRADEAEGLYRSLD